ncbi:MAG: hypothetical protein D3910_13085, partial [Candidatus Electrothrix sp. ATG2]|nr:hypothetical protein [Candidatus Electrothrix sp. ATG2]
MRELLLLDLAGFRCGVWKEDILSHDEQNIHWLTDNDGPVTAIAMMGEHPVSLADLSYCLGLASARRSGRHPVLVPAEHEFSVGFVVEHEAGEAQIPSQRIFSLPPYLQTTFINSCVQHDGKLVPLINIQAIHHLVATVGYTPPTPQLFLPAQEGKKGPTLDALRFFTCNTQSFATSADYFLTKQAHPAGPLTELPLLPPFVRGITLHNKRVHTVLDICTLLHLSSTPKNGEEKWLISEVEGQGFAFVITADLGRLSRESVTLTPLPLLVRSDWQQGAVIHKQNIIPVLDLKALLARQPDGTRSHISLPALGSDGRFEAVFGTKQVDIVEVSLCHMTHALPDIEVADTIPFSHCQRLTGTQGLIAGITLYRGELLPILDPAR